MTSIAQLKREFYAGVPPKEMAIRHGVSVRTLQKYRKAYAPDAPMGASRWHAPLEKEVLALLRDKPDGMSGKDIWFAMNIAADTFHLLIHRMKRKGLVEREIKSWHKHVWKMV